VLVCSELDAQEALREFGRDHVAGFLQKPYRADQLARAVREALGLKAGRSAELPD
jgi:DNA-binding NarL/FixJ family response regulator